MGLRRIPNEFQGRVAAARWRLLLASVAAAAMACSSRTTAPGALEKPGTPEGELSVRSSSPFAACEEPTPLGGGWERCANGLVHRSVTGQCSSSVPRVAGIDPDVIRRTYPDAGAGGADAGTDDTSASSGAPWDSPECIRDSDCTRAPYGHCEPGFGPEGMPVIICQYGCVADSDCRTGEVCECGSGPVGTCVASSCSTDSDCAGAGMCASFDADPGCNQRRFGCQTASDECATAADCGERQECTMSPDNKGGAWHCELPTCFD